MISAPRRVSSFVRSSRSEATGVTKANSSSGAPARLRSFISPKVFFRRGYDLLLLLSARPDIERRRHVEIVGDIALFAVRPSEELLLVLVACAVDNVADDRACGGQLARASAVEYDIAYRVAAHENCVENIVNACELAVMVDECGADYRIDVLAVLALARSAEKLYNSAPVLGVFDILECYLGYALGVNLVG